MGLFSSLFGGSQQSSSQQSSASSQAGSFIDPRQQRFLDQLRNQSFGTLGPLAAQGGQFGGQLAQGLTGAGLGLLGQAAGPGAANAQIGALQGLLQQNQELGLNQIQSRFGQAGSIGSRAGVEGGQLLEGSQRALALGSGQIMGQTQQAQLGAASQLPGLFNLGISGFQGAAGPLQALAQILGDPTILNQAQSQSTSSATSSGSSSGGILSALAPFALAPVTGGGSLLGSFL